MGTNKMRERFLAWLDPAWNRESFIDDDGDEVFTDHWVQGAWVGWVASRGDVVVELPKPYSDHRLASKLERHARASAIHECHAAIEAQGIRVSP